MKILSLPISACILSAIIGIAASGQAAAQVDIPTRCRAVSQFPKVYACCAQIVAKNPNMAICAQLDAVFRCSNKNTKSVPPAIVRLHTESGCAVPKL